MKYIIQRANLNNNYDGGISSYKLFIMIICFAEEKCINTNHINLGEFIIKLLRFYAMEFDYTSTVLRYKKGDKCVISF